MSMTQHVLFITRRGRNGLAIFLILTKINKTNRNLKNNFDTKKERGVEN